MQDSHLGKPWFIDQRKPKSNQIIRIMKLTSFLILIGFLHARANGFGQNITLVLKNSSLSEAFKKIEKQSDYVFWYNEGHMKLSKPITVNIKDASIETAMAMCMAGQPLDFTIRGKSI